MNRLVRGGGEEEEAQDSHLVIIIGAGDNDIQLLRTHREVCGVLAKEVVTRGPRGTFWFVMIHPRCLADSSYRSLCRVGVFCREREANRLPAGTIRRCRPVKRDRISAETATSRRVAAWLSIAPSARPSFLKVLPWIDRSSFLSRPANISRHPNRWPRRVERLA